MINFNEGDSILKFEAGELRGRAVLDLFSRLIKDKRAWDLGLNYKKMAKSLIDRGYISPEGIIIKGV